MQSFIDSISLQVQFPKGYILIWYELSFHPALYIFTFSLYFFSFREHPFSLRQKGRHPADGWEELSCWTGTKKSFGDISNWHFFSWCLINSKICWCLETSVAKTRCSSNEILIWQKYSAKLSSHALSTVRKSSEKCSTFPCPLLYVSKWVHSMNMNTEHVYCLFLRMWLGKQTTVLTLWPLQHASSYKTSLVIASYRILKRTFNRYGDMVGTHKEEKMWKEEKRNLRGESDDSFQGLCTTCCNFYEKLEKKKE